MWADRLQKQETRLGGGVAIFLYNLAILLILPVAVAYLAVQLLVHRRYRESLLARLGFLSRADLSSPHGTPETKSHGPVLWIHAVSVGEVVAVTPLVRRLRQCFPNGRLVVSTITETGQATARQKIPEADEFIYFPFDLRWIVGKVIRVIRPSLFVFLETEIWPNFLYALAKKGIPSVMVNGRISSRSYKGYRLVAPFFRKVLEGVRLFSVQTDLDRQRLIALGVDPSKVVKTGNMKYDQATLEISGDLIEIRKGLRLPTSCDLILAGSTHEGEEEAMASCYRSLSKKYPGVRLLLAPRHLDRIERIEGLLQRQGLKVVRRTKIDSCGFSVLPSDTVILLDTLGELQRLYSMASLVFVGGSLVPIGGHNVLEPAALAMPILFGPHMETYHEIAQLLVERQGACQVADTDELLDQMDRLLANPDQSARMGMQAREVVLEQQGVVEKNLTLLRGILGD